MSRKLGAPHSSSRLFGTLFLVLAPVCYAIAMNYVRRLHGLTLTVMLTWAFGVAAVFLLPLVLVLEGVPGALPPETWGAIAIIGIVLTGLSMSHRPPTSVWVSKPTNGIPRRARLRAAAASMPKTTRR